jgi:branched-chain amino acid transport system permease protein
LIQVLGINIVRLNHVIFAVCAALAGFAGAMAGPLLAVQSGMGEPVLIVTLVVIVIGGIGSIRGGFIAAMLIGLVDTFGRVLLPAALGSIIVYLLMALVLLFRPTGLFPVPGAGTHAASGASSSNPAGSNLSTLRLLSFSSIAVLVFFAAVPVVAIWLGEPFYIRFFTRTMLFGIAVLGLGLILNYGGMVAFGHAAFVGVASYAVAILAYHASEGSTILGLPGTHNALIAWPIAIACSAALAFVIGAVSVRTTGLYFIMITLVFAQMLFYFLISLPTYGGESGLQMSRRSELWFIELGNRTSFYYLVLGVLAACMALMARIMRSPFGLVLNGCRQNERRMKGARNTDIPIPACGIHDSRSDRRGCGSSVGEPAEFRDAHGNVVAPVWRIPRHGHHRRCGDGGRTGDRSACVSGDTAGPRRLDPALGVVLRAAPDRLRPFSVLILPAWRMALAR